jgi:hypothetical protein
MSINILIDLSLFSQQQPQPPSLLHKNPPAPEGSERGMGIEMSLGGKEIIAPVPRALRDRGNQGAKLKNGTVGPRQSNAAD